MLGLSLLTSLSLFTPLCATGGVTLGWWLPTFAAALARRWGLFEGAGEQRPRAEGNTRREAAPPLWHRMGLALAVAAAFASASSAFHESWELVAALGMLAWLGLVAAIDLQTHLIPDRLIYPALVLAPFFVALWPEASWGANLLGGVAGAALFGLFFAVSPSGIGFGDVKLALVLGLYLGWSAIVVALATTVSLGGLAGLALLAAGRGRKAAMPYGPMLAAGAAVALLHGDALWQAYLGYSGPG